MYGCMKGSIQMDYATFPDDSGLCTILIQNIKQFQFLSIQHSLLQNSFYIINQLQRKRSSLLCQQPKENPVTSQRFSLQISFSSPIPSPLPGADNWCTFPFVCSIQVHVFYSVLAIYKSYDSSEPPG